MLYLVRKDIFMAIGKSNRIVIDIDPALKKRLYSILTRRGLSLKEWFQKKATQFVEKEMSEYKKQRNN